MLIHATLSQSVCLHAMPIGANPLPGTRGGTYLSLHCALPDAAGIALTSARRDGSGSWSRMPDPRPAAGTGGSLRVQARGA
jgi:hypothetical protein